MKKLILFLSVSYFSISIKAQSEYKNLYSFMLRPNIKASITGLVPGHYDLFTEFPLNAKNSLELRTGYFKCRKNLKQEIKRNFKTNHDDQSNEGPVIELRMKHYTFNNHPINASRYFAFGTFYQRIWYYHEFLFTGSPGSSFSQLEEITVRANRYGARFIIGAQSQKGRFLIDYYAGIGVAFTAGTRILYNDAVYYSSGSTTAVYYIPEQSHKFQYFSPSITLGINLGLYL